MLKGRLISLRLLTDSEEDLEFRYRTSIEELNIQNLSDKFLCMTKGELDKNFKEQFYDKDNKDFTFAIMLKQRSIGIVYILVEDNKRTAEIQVLLSDEKYRHFGVGFDAIFIATKFAKEELNLHSITFKVASHNKQMVSAFKMSQYAYNQLLNNNDLKEEEIMADIVLRDGFTSRGKKSDYYTYTFVLDQKDFPFEKFLKISSGIYIKKKRGEKKNG